MSDIDFGEVEAAAAAAKAAYRADPTPAKKAAHREAAQALSDAREARRGSVVVVPQSVAATTSVQNWE